MIMKNISILIFFSILFMGCEYNPQQLYERPRDPIAPVLSVEGVTTFVVSEDLSDFFYSALSWTQADFGKGVSAKYELQVSDEIDFSGNVISVDLATDAPMRVLNATELYGWAVERSEERRVGKVCSYRSWINLMSSKRFNRWECHVVL